MHSQSGPRGREPSGGRCPRAGFPRGAGRGGGGTAPPLAPPSPGARTPGSQVAGAPRLSEAVRVGELPVRFGPRGLCSRTTVLGQHGSRSRGRTGRGAARAPAPSPAFPAPPAQPLPASSGQPLPLRGLATQVPAPGPVRPLRWRWRRGLRLRPGPGSGRSREPRAGSSSGTPASAVCGRRGAAARRAGLEEPRQHLFHERRGAVSQQHGPAGRVPSSGALPGGAGPRRGHRAAGGAGARALDARIHAPTFR